MPVGVGAYRRDQSDVGGQVDEVAGEELQVGVDRAEFDLTVKQHPRDPRRLWPRIGIVEPSGYAALEYIQVLGQHDARLHHVEIVDIRRIEISKGGGENVRLLLIIPLEADPVTGLQHGSEEGSHILKRDVLAARMDAAGANTVRSGGPLLLPHVQSPPSWSLWSYHCIRYCQIVKFVYTYIGNICGYECGVRKFAWRRIPDGNCHCSWSDRVGWALHLFPSGGSSNPRRLSHDNFDGSG